MSAAEFADQVIATSPRPDASYTFAIHSVNLDGRVATAVLDEEHYLGASFRNHFGLVFTSDGWKIASKVFTTRPANSSAPE